MKKYYYKYLIIVGILLVLLIGCNNIETDTCESDYKDGNWDDVINGDCPTWMKGAAYMGKAGFNFFKFMSTSESSTSGQVNLISILGLDANNISTKLGYFTSAISAVESTYSGKGKDDEKSALLIGSIMAFYIQTIHDLDNGGDGADSSVVAVDGNITETEVETFAKMDSNIPLFINANFSPEFQVETEITISGSTFFMFDGMDYYLDTDADGIRNGNALPAVEQLAIANNTIKANTLLILTDVITPLTADTETQIKSYTSSILTYLNNVTTVFGLLGLDASNDFVVEVNKIKNGIDNGGLCVNSSTSLLNLMIGKAAKDERSDYSTVNLLTIDELSAQGVPDLHLINTGGLVDSTSDIGIRMLFQKADATNSPYWSGARAAVKNSMETFSKISPGNDVTGDNFVSLHELMCSPGNFN